MAKEDLHIRGAGDIGHSGLELRQILVKARVVGALEREDVDRDAASLEGQELVEDESLRKDWKLLQNITYAA
jgi:hypothetical protein